MKSRKFCLARADAEPMEPGKRKTVWIAAAAMVAVVSGIVATTDRGEGDTPVETAVPATEAISERDGTTTTGPAPISDGQTAADLRRFAPTTTTTTTSTSTTTTTTTAPPTSAAPSTTSPAFRPTQAPPAPPPPTTAPPPPPTQPPAPATAGRDTGCESYMYDQINANRDRSLSFDGAIQHVAVNWSSRMADSQNLAHNPGFGDQIGAVRGFRSAAENVGRGHELGSIFQAFMNSAGHRANIQNQTYSHVTVGCVKDGNGQYWVTQNFWG